MNDTVQGEGDSAIVRFQILLLGLVGGFESGDLTFWSRKVEISAENFS